MHPYPRNDSCRRSRLGAPRRPQFRFCENNFHRMSRAGNTEASPASPPLCGQDWRKGGNNYSEGGFLRSKKWMVGYSLFLPEKICTDMRLVKIIQDGSCQDYHENRPEIMVRRIMRKFTGLVEQISPDPGYQNR